MLTVKIVKYGTPKITLNFLKWNGLALQYDYMANYVDTDQTVLKG